MVKKDKEIPWQNPLPIYTTIMNEELKQKLANFGSTLIDQLENGAIWAKDQSGKLAEEIVGLYIVENITYLIIGVAIVGVLVFFGNYCKKAKNDREKHDNCAREFFSAFHVICFVASLLVGITFSSVYVPRIVKGCIAPRVVILEKLQDFVNASK